MENNTTFDLNRLLDPAFATEQASNLAQRFLVWIDSPGFYVQLGLSAGAVIGAFLLARIVNGLFLTPADQSDINKTFDWRRLPDRLRPLLFPLFSVVLLSAAAAVSKARIGGDVLLHLVESLMLIQLFRLANRSFTSSPLVRRFVSWVLIPIAVMYIFNWLGPVVAWLDTVRMTSGNISLSLYSVFRVLVFGTVLFWLGRKSNDTGKQYIRQQEDLDVGTREVFAKLFEIGLFFLIFILLLQIIGINLTTLTVFGGALGVGLGFGLQAIASNFVSGLILLMDRSLTVGDYVELEDGRAGTIRELTMRSAILKTFEGKDIVVPNETFVTSSFINWTHDNLKQRNSIEFQVSYHTDIEPMLKMLKELVATHPQVISGDQATPVEEPDAEISGFGDSGVDILIEYWMEGIDDGRNRVNADLLLMIWKALKEHSIEIPFPQREVRIVGGASAPGG